MCDVLCKAEGLIPTDPEDCCMHPEQMLCVHVSAVLGEPASTPVYWIAKWADYSDKYGLGYQLCDNSVGVLFNDRTKFIMDAAGEYVPYEILVASAKTKLTLNLQADALRG